MSDIDMAEVCAWAREGGVIARRLFNHVTVRRKADRTVVTEADEQIEQVLVERISARYPDHGILGEERTRRTTEREFVWAIDPLDGTSAFVSGLPTWCVSIGLLRAGQPYAGVIHLPLLDDFYWAGPAGGAFLNEQPLSIRPDQPLESEDWLAVPSNLHRRFKVDFGGKVRSLGSIAAGFCYVVRGSAAAALIASSSLWDVAAGLALLQAVGGTICDLSGRRLDPAGLLDGHPMREPQIIGAPAVVEEFRQRISYQARR